MGFVSELAYMRVCMTGCLHLLCVWDDSCLGYCFYMNPSRLDVSAHEHPVMNNGLNYIQWPPLYQMYKLNLGKSTGDSQDLQLGSPCGV